MYKWLAIETTTTQPEQEQQQQQQQTHPKKPEVTITRASSSLHSVNAEKSSSEVNGTSYNMTTTTTTTTTSSSSPPPPQSPSLTNDSTTVPIFIRLSNNGQDITIQVPVHPPYITVSGLRKELLPHLEPSARVKLIYLGRILPDGHVIVPTTTTDSDAPLPPPKNRAIQIQKEGVIQAMVTRG